MGYSLHYYDLVLVCIAASLGLGFLVGYATRVPLEVSVIGLGLISIAFIAHALFVNGPVDQPADLTEEVDVEEVPKVLSPVDSPE
ncbi:hypothetical protein [Halopiger djelfimassiliensis]|uniref:hypothetical protein n=1 Tax=Halopiger djelfimassiliensis TaxID=1293047 RepID=UPI0006777ADE|nr:hypothetical protein [Halopiger djelfimassiliensis]